MNKTGIQAALLITLAIAILLNTNFPLEPSGASTNTTKDFRWIGLSKTVKIDDNKDFTSPIIIRQGEETRLQPGEYYWKTTGISTTKQFRIDSEITIKVNRINENTFSIENKGNTAIELETRPKITSAAVIDTKQSINKTITENSTFLAQQNE
jgi:hypothetical protein